MYFDGKRKAAIYERNDGCVMFQTGQEKKGVSLVRQSIVVGFVLG